MVSSSTLKFFFLKNIDGSESELNMIIYACIQFTEPKNIFKPLKLGLYAEKAPYFCNVERMLILTGRSVYYDCFR